jgi:hypothetical protein
MNLSLCSEYDPIGPPPVHTHDIRVLTCFDVEQIAFVLTTLQLGYRSLHHVEWS